MFFARTRTVVQALAIGFAAIVLVGLTPTDAASAIAFVQGNYATPQSSVNSVTIPFTLAQKVGDLNVVVVGWNDSTATVSGVTDTSGNIYFRAVGPTVQTGLATQSIYYAKNIAAAGANVNRVTVTFNVAAVAPDIRIAEYSGLDITAPVDTTAAAMGTGTSANSGAATTTNANDLIVGANLVQTGTGAAGTGFTKRMITSPDSDILEDRVVTATGSYSAVAPMTSSGGWIMQMVAFRAAGSAPPDTTPPTAPTNLTATAASSSQINLSWGASTDPDSPVSSYSVERCAGAGCTSFLAVAAPTGTTLNDTGLVASTTYNYRVLAKDPSGNASPYSNVASATTLAPPPPDTTPPTAPTNLTATAASSSAINLNWGASTDPDSPVSGYSVERCTGASCTNFAAVGAPTGTSFSDTGLTASTAYNYRVLAKDPAGNASSYSNTASATTNSAPLAITFIQGNYATPQTGLTSVTVPYTAAQSAGDLNVVIVGWNDSTATVNSVTDTSNNAYALAGNPVVLSGSASQAIYYAKGIAGAGANANSVTVKFNGAAAFPDMRILEYSGIDSSTPFDVAAGATGTNATSSSGAVTTTNANDLLVGANLVLTGTSGPGSGFTQRLLTAPDGDIAEDRVVSATGSYSASASLSSAGGWVMQMVAFRAAGSAPPPPDTTPPSVSITAPSSGASVSGLSSVSASASDNVAVAGVQFNVDGAPLGTEVTTPPYAVSWDTTSLVNGSTHTLTAVARDTSNNKTTSSPVTVTVVALSTVGQWSGVQPWPIVAVNTALMRTGKVLAWDGQSFGFNGEVWDPVANTFTAVTSPVNLFCSGLAELSDGTVIVGGGHQITHTGLPSTTLFNPATQTWSSGADMNFQRWYPTVTALPDGRALVMSGETNCDGCDVAIPEVYDPTSNTWTQLSKATLTVPYYPHMFVLSDGRVLNSSTTEAPIATRVLDIGKQTWTVVDSNAVDGGSAAMYLPGKVLKTGTSTDPDTATRPSAPTAYVLDMNQPSPAWRQVASMAFARTYHTLTLLPDGTVLVTGGSTTTDAIDATTAVAAAELWSPTTETFKTLAPMNAPRLYHSTALLLPDARVLIAGGGRFNGGTNPEDQLSAEIYSPPYLFKGARPSIASAPSVLQYAQAFSVQTPDAASIASVSLMRLGAVTHDINQNQSFLPLVFQIGSGVLTVQAPANANLAPPGFYMLFLVNTNGVPSVAAMLSLPVPSKTGPPPTAPSGLVATASTGAVSLTWTASTSTVGIDHYNVYRATAPGVAITPANKIGQSTTTSYTDTNFTSSGTFYYVVNAADTSGATSAASNEVVATVQSDLTPPTAPSNLVATVVGSTQINLAWTASTDNVAVTAYLVERCQGSSCASFSQVGSVTTTGFSDTGLTTSTNYSYRVRASDGAGNLSNYSNIASGTTTSVPATIAFVQVNSATPQSAAVTSVPVKYTAAQKAGDLNVVVVGWNDSTATVSSVTDSSGNSYALAVGPTIQAGVATQSIYYAKNIAAAAANANTVTVTFGTAAAFPDVRIVEYSGVDPLTPVDVTAAAIGITGISDSGAVTTNNANDMIFGANLVQTSTEFAGSGFTLRTITPTDGDAVEDMLVSATGSYNASAALSRAGGWIMQLIAFRAAGSPPPAAAAVEGGTPPPQ